MLLAVDVAVLVADVVPVDVALVVGLVVGVVSRHPANVPSENPRTAPFTASTTSAHVSSSRTKPPAVQPTFNSTAASNPCTTLLSPASIPQPEDVSRMKAKPFFFTHASSTNSPEHSSTASSNALICTSHRPRGATK